MSLLAVRDVIMCECVRNRCLMCQAPFVENQAGFTSSQESTIGVITAER